MSNEEQQISLFKLGSLVNLRISAWSARKMMTPTDMSRMGIDIKDLPVEIVNLGRKMLVPIDAIKRISKIEQKARTFLARWSVQFGPASCFFVPITKLPDVEAQLSEMKKEFEQEVDDFIANFDKMRSTMEEKYADFWEKCLKAHYPASAQLLRNKFGFGWHQFRINLPETSETNAQALAQEMQESVSEFVKNYISSMREEVIKFCELMDARVNGKVFRDEEEVKKLTGKSVSSFSNFVKRFQTMNIFGDTEIEKMLNEFKDQFLTDFDSEETFDNDQIKAGVTQTLSSIREKAMQITDQESQFVDKLKRKIVI